MIQNMLRNDPRFANDPMLQNSMEQLTNNPQMMSQMMNDPTMRSRMQAMMGSTGRMPGGMSDMRPMQRPAHQGQQPRPSNHSNTPMSDQEMTEEEMLQEAIQRSLRES